MASQICGQDTVVCVRACKDTASSLVSESIPESDSKVKATCTNRNRNTKEQFLAKSRIKMGLSKKQSIQPPILNPTYHFLIAAHINHG